jgi:hypothetical protein
MLSIDGDNQEFMKLNKRIHGCLAIIDLEWNRRFVNETKY